LTFTHVHGLLERVRMCKEKHVTHCIVSMF